MPGTFGEDYDWRDFPQLRAAHGLWMQRLEQVLPKEVFYALSDEEKQKAYTVARLWDDRARTEALYSIRDAILQGKTVRQWRKDSWDELADKYGKAGAQAPWYRDVVFRTNTQTAFAGGRYADMFSPDGVVQAPFWMFSAIHDARTRPTHAALDGKVFRKDDPAARRYLPPLGFNCRCSCIGLDQEDVQAGGYKVMNGAEIPAIPLEDGSGTVGPPEKGWDADRVQTTVPKALGPAQTPPPAARPTAPQAPAPPPPPPPAQAPPAPPPAPPAGGPAGVAVSTHVKKLPSKRRKDVETVLAAIDAVHGDGSLGKMEVKFGAGSNGWYKGIGVIKVGSTAPHWAVQLAHEIGHWIDYRGVAAWSGRSNTSSVEMQGVMAAILKSQAVSNLAKSTTGSRRAYLLRPTELWARAYSQFVAEESGDATLKAHVALWRSGKAAGREPDGMWEELDFAPIRTEIRELMRRLGWLT